MSIRWIGCVLIISASGFCGFSFVRQYRREEKLLYELHCVIQNMECELSYHLSPLPELVEHSAAFAGGSLKALLLRFSENLKAPQLPDAASCLAASLESETDFPPRILEILHILSCSLGRFDLAGQLKGFAELQDIIAKERLLLDKNRETRLRSYCTLGICTGIALAILLI